MILSAIVAAAQNDVIGNKGTIPWYLPADFAHFKKTTMGHAIIMGSVTHDSLKRILPGRKNIVLNNIPNYKAAEGAVVVGSLEEALNLDEVKNDNEVFIAGGQSIYELAMPLLQKIYLTRVHTNPEGDRFFRYNPDEWVEISREPYQKDKKNNYDYDFIVLKRKN